MTVQDMKLKYFTYRTVINTYLVIKKEDTL